MGSKVRIRREFCPEPQDFLALRHHFQQDFVLPLDSASRSKGRTASRRLTQRGVLRGPGMVERVFVVVRRDEEPADGIGIAGVGKMPRVVRLGLSVWHRKSSSGVSGGRRRGD